MKNLLDLKAQWIYDEAIGYIKSWDCYIAKYNDIDEYKTELSYDFDEVDIEEITEDINVNSDLPFFLIEESGTDLHEYMSIENVDTHEDLLRYFDDNELYKRSRKSQLLYVTQSKYEKFKNLIKREFGNEFSKSPYSKSAYNATDIGWGHKPHGSYRVSDHWDFETFDFEIDDYVVHCQTDKNIEDGLAIAQYDENTQQYKVVFEDGASSNVVPVKVTESGITFLEDGALCGTK